MVSFMWSQEKIQEENNSNYSQVLERQSLQTTKGPCCKEGALRTEGAGLAKQVGSPERKEPWASAFCGDQAYISKMCKGISLVCLNVSRSQWEEGKKGKHYHSGKTGQLGRAGCSQPVCGNAEARKYKV